MDTNKMERLGIGNFITVTLGAELSAVATSATLSSGEGALLSALTPPYRIVWDEEVLEVTERATDVLTVARAQEGSSAVIHYAGAAGKLAVTAGHLDEVFTKLTDLIALVSYLRGAADGCVRNSGTGDVLEVTAEDPVSLSVEVADGMALISNDYYKQTSTVTLGPVSAPTGDTRIDVVEATLDGTVSLVTGSEGGAAPSVDADSIALAQITCRVGMTSIKDADDASNGYITDARSFV